MEKLGYYNPNTTPATIELNNDKALYWLQVGAQPTPTVDRILTYRGVKYRKHLLRGVRLGVISQEDADNKYAKWLEDKAEEIQKKVSQVQQKSQEEAKQRLEAEAAINRKRAEAIQGKPKPSRKKKPKLPALGLTNNQKTMVKPPTLRITPLRNSTELS